MLGSLPGRRNVVMGASSSDRLWSGDADPWAFSQLAGSLRVLRFASCATAFGPYVLEVKAHGREKLDEQPMLV